MVVFSPPARQSVRLHYTYVIGRGIPKPTATDEDVQAVIDDLWEDPDNREFCTHEGQCETDARLQIDGEVFVALYTNAQDGHVKMRTVDPLDVQDVITHPDDKKRPLYYRVRVHQDLYDFEKGTVLPHHGPESYVYFPDWRNTDSSRDPFHGQVRAYLAPNGACMAHFAVGRMGLRGISDFCSANVWISQHKKFMENRAIITEALAKIAFVKTVKGGPGQVAASAAFEQSSLATNLSGFERNPAPAPASTYVKNPGIDFEQLKVDTGAGQAVQDGEMLAQMLGTALGWPTHYILMSQEAHTLATSVAMELPVLKAVEDAQERWKDMLTRLIDFALVQAAKHQRLPVPVQMVHGYETLVWELAQPSVGADEEAQEETLLEQPLQPLAQAPAGGKGGGGGGGEGGAPGGGAPPGGSNGASGGVQETVSRPVSEVRTGDVLRDSAGWPLEVRFKRHNRKAGRVRLVVHDRALDREVLRDYAPDDHVAIVAVREMEPAQLQAQAQQYQQQRDPTFKGREAKRQRGHYSIDVPSALSRDAQQYIGAVVQALQAGTLTPEQGARLTMIALGMPNPDEAFREWKLLIEQHAAQQQQQQQQQLQLQQQALQQQAQAGGQGNPYAATQPPPVPTPNLQPPQAQQGPPTTASQNARVPSGGLSRNPQ